MHEHHLALHPATNTSGGRAARFAGIAVCVVAVLAPAATARADTIPAPTRVASPSPGTGSASHVGAHGCPVPAPGRTPNGAPSPAPQAGASPSPSFPKAGSPGNCRPVSPNLAAPQPVPAANPSGSGPSWWDIPGQIEQAINTWLGDLAQAMLAPIMGLFTMALLSEPTVTSGRIAQLWQANVLLADSFYVLYVVVGGLLIMGYGTVQTRYTAKQIVPRLVLGMIASNLSLPVIGLMIQLTAAIAGALWSQPLNPAGVGDQVVQVIISMIMLPDGLTQIVMAIFALVICVLALAVLVTCALRIAALLLLTMLAPIVLATHALPGIDGAARLWWRAMGAVLGTQILQTLTFMLLLQVFCDPDAAILIFPTSNSITDFLVGSALLILMLKTPGWMNRVMLGPMPRSFVGQVLRTAAVAALGYRFGMPGAYSTRSITGRLVTNRLHGGGNGGGGFGPLGAIPPRPRAPRGPGPASGYRRLPGANSSALIRAVARSNGGNLVAAAQQVTSIATATLPPAPGLAVPAPLPAQQPTQALGHGGLAPIGGRGFGSSRGSHSSGQLALWPVPRGAPIPQPASTAPPTSPTTAPPLGLPLQPFPGQLQLPGFGRTPPVHTPGAWPSRWRSIPAYTIPRERRVPAPAGIPAPTPPPEVRPEDFTGQAPLFTKTHARALQPKPPRAPKRRNLAVVFLAPNLPDEEGP